MKRTRKERRTAANARHIAPAGAMSMAAERLLERTSLPDLQRWAAATARGEKNPDRHLIGHGEFCVAGRMSPVAYAGGAIIAHLPRSQAHRHLPHMKRG